MNELPILCLSSNRKGSKGSQDYLKSWHQLGTDPPGKVTNGSLVRCSASPEGQDKCIDRNDGSHSEETQRNDCKCSANDARPSDTR